MIKNYQLTIDMIVEAMRNQAKQAHTTKTEVDISGGVDSAVVAALSCLAFGNENVIGVYSSIDSSQDSRRRAQMVADRFGFRLVDLNLSYLYWAIVDQVEEVFKSLNIPFPDIDDPKFNTVFGSLRSCLRAPVGRFVNRAFGGGIRQGTGNRDEDELIRFYQKGGDGEVDCNWIEGLFKSEVWELAAHLGVPQEIIDAEPTPDLWAGGNHTDEKELKDLTGAALTYTRPSGPMGTLEWASRENKKNGCCSWMTIPAEKMAELYGYTSEQIEVILAIRKLEQSSRHKVFLPPYLAREQLVYAGALE